LAGPGRDSRKRKRIEVCVTVDRVLTLFVASGPRPLDPLRANCRCSRACWLLKLDRGLLIGSSFRWGMLREDVWWSRAFWATPLWVRLLADRMLRDPLGPSQDPAPVRSQRPPRLEGPRPLRHVGRGRRGGRRPAGPGRETSLGLLVACRRRRPKPIERVDARQPSFLTVFSLNLG